ncbi:MAG: DUF2695 domain-containing protein [Phycisphaerae bacterium]
MKWLAGLFKHLGERLEQDGCDNTMRLATDFLQDSDECDDCGDALEWLAERGAFCDCEVLLNVEPPDDGDAIQASTRAYERIIEAVDEYENAKKRMG